jgi:hypothetical protein
MTKGHGKLRSYPYSFGLKDNPMCPCEEEEQTTDHLTFNPLNAELNPIRHLLALVGARHIVHVSRVRVKCKKLSKHRKEVIKQLKNTAGI